MWPQNPMNAEVISRSKDLLSHCNHRVGFGLTYPFVLCCKVLHSYLLSTPKIKVMLGNEVSLFCKRLGQEKKGKGMALPHLVGKTGCGQVEM